MSQKIINIGLAANDRKGDKARDAFSKVNDNFTELYTVRGAFKKVVITAEQFANCYVAPVVCLDNPGANKFNMVNGIYTRWQPGSAPWVNETLVLKTGSLVVASYSSLIVNDNERWLAGVSAVNAGTPFPINQPTILTTLLGHNPSGGNGGTITLYINYSIVDV